MPFVTSSGALVPSSFFLWCWVLRVQKFVAHVFDFSGAVFFSSHCHGVPGRLVEGENYQ